MLKILIRSGAEVKTRDVYGMSPLMSAKVNGRSEIIGLLAEMGKDQIEVDADGNTPLHRALLDFNGDDLGLIQRLIDSGENINALNRDGFTLLHMAIIKGYENVFKLLLCRGANVNLPAGKIGESPLHQAVQMGNSEVVKLLIGHRAHVNIRLDNLACWFGRSHSRMLLYRVVIVK